MTITITTRLPEKFVSSLNEIAKEEHLDKSTVIRKLLAKAIADWRKDYAVEKYKSGEFSLGQAKSFAEMDIWNFLNLLKQKKVNLNYDLEELEEDLKIIKWKKKQ